MTNRTTNSLKHNIITDKIYPLDMYLKSFIYSGYLEIKLSNDLDELTILFENPSTFRVAQESARLNSLDDYQDYLKYKLLESMGSEYLDWFKAESFIPENLPFRHFVILTPNEIVDVISQFSPIITNSN